MAEGGLDYGGVEKKVDFAVEHREGRGCESWVRVEEAGEVVDLVAVEVEDMPDEGQARAEEGRLAGGVWGGEEGEEKEEEEGDGEEEALGDCEREGGEVDEGGREGGVGRCHGGGGGGGGGGCWGSAGRSVR